MERLPIFPEFVGNYPIYNNKGEVDALIIVLLKYEVVDSIFQRSTQSYRLSILDFNQDYRKRQILVLTTKNNQEVYIGMPIPLDISSKLKPLYIYLHVGEESLEFYKKWKNDGAILEPYGNDFWQFSIN